MSKIRKSYVSFGFTKVTRDGRDCAQFLHCSVVMSNPSFQTKKHRIKSY